ncbi:MAG: alpha-L-fucosidase [Kiritimatiellales bacterium]|nr:alpha-L-fucosidase [Kiritimatiellales bacterium]
MNKRIFIAAVCLFTAVWVGAKKYEPTWESLDSRETPGWYRDAKFGIFIHWGLYSVPAWSPRGTYAEWYWNAKDGIPTKNAANVERSSKVSAFHNRVYGKDVAYKNFRTNFTCEMFEPQQWAEVLKRSGAKYVVLTSKHHDGYCLWPNKEASESFGMDWNSVDSGPKRDLCGDLGEAVRAAGLKMGLYYSIWDWFNPYWPEDQQLVLRQGKKSKADAATKQKAEAGLDKYIKQVMYPQFKEIVTKYQPALIFSDGDWWMDDDKWQTKPLLAWLFNNAPNKDEVVINDRWGKVRGLHGGYFTTEYGSGFDDPSVLWEENRGIGKSFGYNREETYNDYNSEKLLLFMLVDIVSRGGNFLLDIGPTSDGRIPVIMEDRLVRMGEWLDINGEAIFGSRRWKRHCQWSAGEVVKYTKQDFHKGIPDPMLEMTIMPRDGQAVKECYFTAKGDTVYAMIPKLPDGGKFTVRDIEISDGTEVTMLGIDGKLKYQLLAGHLVVDLPPLNPTSLPCEHIFTLKITKVKSSIKPAKMG